MEEAKKKKIRIGTRKSQLAMVQTEIVADRIRNAFKEIQIEIVPISTKGDENLHRSLASFGGKGVFTRELEEAMREGRIDLAVHSAKDLPMDLPKGLCIGAALGRGDASQMQGAFRQPAFHTAAPALYGGDPCKGSGGKRYWSPFYLCGDDFHHNSSRIRSPRWKGSEAYGAGRSDYQAYEGTVPKDCER